MNYKNFAQGLNNRAGQVPNRAGGFAYTVDKWQQLNRFLILGSDTGTYYVSPQGLTFENANSVLECLKEDPTRTVDTIVGISRSGRAAKNSPAIFAFAFACTPRYNPQQHNQKYALAQLDQVCRTATHLFEFMEYITQFRGMGRALRTAISNWYLSKNTDALQYQLVKYQQRNGWSHRDVLRLAHPIPISKEISDIFHWVTDPNSPEVDIESHELIWASERVKGALQSEEVVDMVQNYNLPWEAIPTQWLRNTDVRMALLEKMPLTAMIRQIGIYSSLGLTAMKSVGEQKFINAISNTEVLQRARIHPFQILLALQTYSQGHGERGSNTWTVNPRIAEALEASFYSTFSNVPSSDKRILLGIDISGSMRHTSISSMSNMPATMLAAAQALVMVNTEQYCDVVAFDTVAEQRPVNKRSSIGDTMRNFQPRGGTDCGSVIDYAVQNNLVYDAFVILTDSQTWHGNSNPYARFCAYRETFNKDAKLITVAMTSDRYTLGPQGDAGVLDVCGFDTNVSLLISDFLSDKF